MCTCVRVCVYIHIFMCTYVYINIYTYICLYVYMCVIRTCMYIYILYICIYIYIYICTYVYINIYTYICMYIYMQNLALSTNITCRQYRQVHSTTHILNQIFWTKSWNQIFWIKYSESHSASNFTVLTDTFYFATHFLNPNISRKSCQFTWELRSLGIFLTLKTHSASIAGRISFALLQVCVVPVAWLIYMCDMTHSYVWHDSFIFVTWLVRMCDMICLYVWRDAFICVTWLVHICDMTYP